MKNLSFIQKNFFDSLFYAQEVAKRLNTRVANFHDLIELRINQDFDTSFIWNHWFTPLATLYLGKYNGKRLIVIAQHLGPINNKERFLQWADSGKRKEGSGNKQNGSAGLPKISQQEFSDLIEGKYGEVSILDFAEYYRKHGSNIQCSFIPYIKACEDPLLKALFGPKFKLFLDKHFQISFDNTQNKNKLEEAAHKILEFGICDQYGFWLFDSYGIDFPDDQPVALFLSLGRLTSYGRHDLSMVTEIRTQEDPGYARFVVLNDKNDDVFEMVRHF